MVCLLKFQCKKTIPYCGSFVKMFIRRLSMFNLFVHFEPRYKIIVELFF